MAKKRTKKQTLIEFQAWLEGVEEIQENDWAPSQEQWKMIRTRISNIIASEPVTAAAPTTGMPIAKAPTGYHPATTAARNANPNNDVIPILPQVPSSFDLHGIGPGTVPPGIAPAVANSPIAQPAGPGGVPKSGPTTSADGSAFE